MNYAVRVVQSTAACIAPASLLRSNKSMLLLLLLGATRACSQRSLLEQQEQGTSVPLLYEGARGA